jgi:hypothetical protein
VRRAPRRGGHLGETQLAGLVLKSLTEIDVPGALPCSLAAAALDNFRTNFIARSTYPYAAMHYEVN